MDIFVGKVNGTQGCRNDQYPLVAASGDTDSDQHGTIDDMFDPVAEWCG